MKNAINSIKFIFKALLLVLLLMVGWAFINVTHLIKGKKSHEKGAGLTDAFGLNQADADAPASSKATTPFLAYYDGKEYKLENDVLFGRPDSFYERYDVAKTLYEDGRIFPDLYKITSRLAPHNGKVLLQIQEIEPEESFFKWVELERVAHPENTEVIVDSDFKKFYVIDKKRFEEKLVLPLSIIDGRGKDRAKKISDMNSLWQYNPASGRNIFFRTNENVEMTFKNLKRGEIPYLVTKTWFRDWVAGEARSPLADKKIEALDFVTASGLRKIVAAVTILAAGWIYHKFGFVPEFLSFAPIFFGYGSSSSCACLTYAYRADNGEYSSINISGVRSWKYNTEVVELPREAVNSKGEMTLRVMATQRHALGFIGVVQEDDWVAASCRNYRMEKLGLTRAYHSRLQKDVRGALRKGHWKEYLHTIPGDKVDLEFETPGSVLRKNEKETYLFRSSGFYTSLRPEYKKLAGNWQEKISPEAKSRLTTSVPLNEYK